MNWSWVVAGLIALLIGSLLATLQQALQNAGRGPLEELAERRRSPGGIRRVRAIVEDLDGHVTAVALPRIAANLLVVVCAVLITRDLRGVEQAGPADVAIGVAAAAVVIWLLAVALPLAVADHAAERTVLAWSAPLRGWRRVTSPLAPVFRFVHEVVRRLAGVERRTASDELEEELRHVVEEGEREGHIDETERQMIESVVGLRSTTVEQIMTPRTELNAIEATDDLETIKRVIERIGHSRIPVYVEDMDHLSGMLYAKDLLKWMVSEASDRGEAFTLSHVLREITYVPETKTVRECLSELLAAQVHIAVVLDEYGGTSGVVTIEDIVEEIFGEIRDEYEQEEDREYDSVDIDVDARVATLDARMEIDDANTRLSTIHIELPDGEEYDTVAGFVTVSMGKIPEAGEVFTHDGFVVEVLEAEPTRVRRVTVRHVDDSGAYALGSTNGSMG